MFLVKASAVVGTFKYWKCFWYLDKKCKPAGPLIFFLLLTAKGSKTTPKSKFSIVNIEHAHTFRAVTLPVIAFLGFVKKIEILRKKRQTYGNHEIFDFWLWKKKNLKKSFKNIWRTLIFQTPRAGPRRLTTNTILFSRVV